MSGQSFGVQPWAPLAGAAPRGLLTLGSSPCTGRLSVVWCDWTEPVGLSPGKASLSLLGAGRSVQTLGREGPSLVGTAGNLRRGHRAWTSRAPGPSQEGTRVRGRVRAPRSRASAWPASRSDPAWASCRRSVAQGTLPPYSEPKGRCHSSRPIQLEPQGV